jgi:hypothetical protein
MEETVMASNSSASCMSALAPSGVTFTLSRSISSQYQGLVELFFHSAHLGEEVGVRFGAAPGPIVCSRGRPGAKKLAANNVSGSPSRERFHQLDDAQAKLPCPRPKFVRGHLRPPILAIRDPRSAFRIRPQA